MIVAYTLPYNDTATITGVKVFIVTAACLSSFCYTISFALTLVSAASKLVPPRSKILTNTPAYCELNFDKSKRNMAIACGMSVIVVLMVSSICHLIRHL